MKNFVKVLLGIFLLVNMTACSRLPLTSTSDIANLRQIVSTNNSAERTIMWHTNKKQEAAAVEYRLKGTDTIKTVKALEDIFTEDKTTNNVYTAYLKNLKPQQNYEYRVRSKEQSTAWEPLSTKAQGNFKALIFPDSQSSDYSDWQKLALKAWDLNKDAALYINMGDLVDNGEQQSQWQAWFNAVAPFAPKIPLAPVMGNHETYTLDWKVRMPLAYLHYFQLPRNNDPQYQNQYYAFDYGPVHFVVLNTQMKELDEFQPAMLKTQITWLKKDLASTKQKWKVVLLHKDVLQYAFATRKDPRTEGISAEGRIFMPIFDEFKVDAVLSAHLHTYRRRAKISNFKRSDKGPLYILTGVAGNVRYPNLWKKHSLDEYVAPQPETDNYLTMEATENTLSFTCFLPSGEKLDTVLLTK